MTIQLATTSQKVAGWLARVMRWMKLLSPVAMSKRAQAMNKTAKIQVWLARARTHKAQRAAQVG